MIKFVIDIGSNSCRLMKARVIESNIETIYKKLITARTGEGVNETHRLSPAAIKRTSDAVCELYFAARTDDPSAPIYCFATSATRDAENRDEMLSNIFGRTGLSVDVISGETEAEIGYAGAVGMNGGGLIDIGGGSTEVAFGKDGRRSFSHSFDIGAVRAKDMFGDAFNSTYEYTKRLLTNIPHFSDNFYTCGGTTTTIAAMLQDLREYDPTKVHGYIASKSAVQDLFHRLLPLSISELRSLPGLQPERADIIRHGIAILLAVMDALGLERVTVSDSDNLEGYLMKITNN